MIEISITQADDPDATAHEHYPDDALTSDTPPALIEHMPEYVKSMVRKAMSDPHSEGEYHFTETYGLTSYECHWRQY
jgi:hypothetical protein